MDEQKCICEIGFKQVVFEFDDAGFNNLVDETLDALKQRLNEARASFIAKKAAVIAGQPTLQEKGVEISISMKF